MPVTQVSTVVESGSVVPEGVLVPGIVQHVDVVGVDFVAFEHDVVFHFDDGGTAGVADEQFAPEFGDFDRERVSALLPMDRNCSYVLVGRHVAPCAGSSTTAASASK